MANRTVVGRPDYAAGFQVTAVPAFWNATGLVGLNFPETSPAASKSPTRSNILLVTPGERYDVIVRPTEDRAYTIFAESMGRTAYARATLAPREGVTAEVPGLREPPLLTSGSDTAVLARLAGPDGHGYSAHDVIDALLARS